MLPNLHSATEMKPPPVPREGPGAAFTSGETGIRTPDTGLTPYNGLANRRLQPLGHLSGESMGHFSLTAGADSGLFGAPRPGDSAGTSDASRPHEFQRLFDHIECRARPAE